MRNILFIIFPFFDEKKNIYIYPKIKFYPGITPIFVIKTHYIDLKQIYNLIPVKLRIYIQKTEINFFLYVIYSFLISHTKKYFSQT